VAIRESLHVSPGAMGFLLLFWAAGSIVVMPATGVLVARFGIRPTLATSSALALAGLAGAGTSAALDSEVGVAAALTTLGVGMGAWDVAMNVSGSDTERALRRAVMPHFHAAYSLGTIAAAAVGALAAHLDAPLAAHMAFAALVSGGLLVWGIGRTLPHPAHDAVHPPPPPRSPHPPAGGAGADLARNRGRRGAPPRGSGRGGRTSSGIRGALAAWTDRRTLLVGCVLLAMTLAEGTGNDWIASGLVESFHVDESVGILGLGLFLTALTATRVAGARLIDTRGRVVTLRICAAFALVGLGVYGLAPWLPLALAGCFVWGAGAALAFPLGMSAAGEDPALGAQRTSVVATIGYFAFLAGPPLVGALADHWGFRHALLVIMIPTVFTLVAAGAVAPRKPSGAVGAE
jgi:MFS family permease